MRALIERLRGPGVLTAAELRPPRRSLFGSASMDAWIDTYHGVRRLVRADVPVLLTDDAVGQSEEESLHHLRTNLGESLDRRPISPFLTCNHELDYCLRFAQRAEEEGFAQLVVLGGDQRNSARRCVPHAEQLRAFIREQNPRLALGGWANPHRDPVEQVAYLARPEFSADFFLTQIVSHHQLDAVARFLEELDRRSVRLPGLFGVFFYRSCNSRTLRRLAPFLPVPESALREEFEAGAVAEEVCARTIVALRRHGVRHVYVSNLDPARAHRQLAAIEERVGSSLNTQVPSAHGGQPPPRLDARPLGPPSRGRI